MRNEFDIKWVPSENLKLPDWNITYLLKPDRAVAETMLNDWGWLHAIIARTDGTILWGGEYWEIAAEKPKLYGTNVPVIWVECDLADAIIMHIRMYRGRAEVIPRNLSQAIRKLKRTRKYSEEEIQGILRMTWEELDLLLDGTLLKKRKTKEHTYSRAWVPVEAEKGQPIAIERPDTKDE
jgi:hypothetical protein